MAEQMIEPCPFCGGEPVLERPQPSNWRCWSVRCPHCPKPLQPLMSVSEKRAEALAAWNHRAAHSVIAGKVAELESKVEIAATIFEEYGRLHRKKMTPDGDRKAERNEQYAAEMRAALAHPKARNE